jgi:hypothetical protein
VQRTSKNRGFVLAIACGLALGAGVGTALAQGSVSDPAIAGDFDASAVGKIGRLHDDLRRAAARRGLSTEAADVYSDYLALKARMATQTGLAWSMDLSYLQQWGRPDGGSPAGQVLATPSLEWTLFDSAAIGTGSAQLAYTVARYGTERSAADLQSSLGLITPINDYPARQNIFAQLTYTHALPNNRLLFSVGQFPISSFDGNPYLGNQQQNFNNYTLTQNASATYAQAGLGAYIQVNATKSLQFVAGLQNASSASTVPPGSATRTGLRRSRASARRSTRSTITRCRPCRRNRAAPGGRSTRRRTWMKPGRCSAAPTVPTAS